LKRIFSRLFSGHHPVVFAVLAICCGWSASARADDIDYKSLYRHAAPGIVVVFGSSGYLGSRGTGSIISQGGLVLTNSHVVSYKGGFWPQLFIYTKPERLTGKESKDLRHRYRARVVAAHPRYDLAVLQILDPPRSLTVLPMSDLKGVGIGEPTVAIGHPGGGALWSLTTGKLSAAFLDYEQVPGWHMFQTETPINPGNSGGPLLDGTGAIIGINTFIKRTGKKGLALVGLSFAVQSITARTWIKKVMGKLPPATLLARASVKTRARPPAPAAVQKAKPVVPRKPMKPAVRRKKKQWRLPAPRSKPREDKLAHPGPRPKQGFTSKIKPGKVYGGASLATLFSQSKRAFNELDSVLNNKKSK